MPKKRKFSFRIPWITRSSSPNHESKSSKHPNSTISIQGSSRKDVKHQSPPRSSKPKKSSSSTVPILTSPEFGTQIQFSSSPSSSLSTTPTPSPSHGASKSQAFSVALLPDSKPGSTSHDSPSKGNNGVLKPKAEGSNKLVSPISNTQPASQPQSPSLSASKPTSDVLKPIAEKSTQLFSPTASQPQSPSLLASKPTAEAKAQLASPVFNIQPASQPSKPTSEALKPNAEKSTKAASPSRLASGSFVCQQQKEKMTSFEPVSQQSEPKTKSPLKSIPKPQEQNQTEKSDRVSNGNSKSRLDSQSKFLKPEEKEKVAPKPIKEAKAKDPTSSKSQSVLRKTTTRLHTTTSNSSDFQSDKKPEETTEKKLMFSTSNPSGTDLRVVSSTDPTNKNISAISLQKDIREEVSKFIQKLANEHPKQNMDDDEKSVSIITIAGDNKGATMQIGSESSKKEESVHIHRAYKTNPDESPEVTTDEEEGEISDEESQSGKEKEEEGKAYINSNVQSINNSLMFHGSITERNPGVQLIFPQNKQENANKAEEKPAFVTRKLTYQPTVRRRCLRGLFLEPSDSDPDNPEKPRRHGCKFRCGENMEEKDVESM